MRHARRDQDEAVRQEQMLPAADAHPHPAFENVVDLIIEMRVRKFHARLVELFLDICMERS